MKDHSFYQFMLTVRDRKGDEGILADEIYHDLSFPKYEKDFDTISEYIETQGTYSVPMSIFDNLYEDYTEWLKF